MIGCGVKEITNYKLLITHLILINFSPLSHQNLFWGDKGGS